MVIALFGFILGAIFGSFADVVANRSIKRKSIWGRSYCLSCKKTLQWYDLFPFFSFIVLKGKCRYCHKTIAAEHFYSELAMGIQFAALFTLTPFNIELVGFDLPTALLITKLLLGMLVCFVLQVIFITDFKTGYIYDRITYPMSALALVLQIVLASLSSWYFYTEFKKSSVAPYLMGPGSTYLSSHIWLIWQTVGMAIATGIGIAGFFALLIIATKGRGMGWGDVKYALFIGFALGFPNGLLAVFLAFLFGAVIGIGLLAIGKKRFGQTIPFGPFLSIGCFIALLWGSQIMEWYLHLGQS